MESTIETLDFKFLLKPKDADTPCIIEEGPTRHLTGGMLEGDVRIAWFKMNGDHETLEFRVFNKADIVSPLDLAASWRVFKENFQPSKVRGIPDVSINVAPAHGTEVITVVQFLFAFEIGLLVLSYQYMMVRFDCKLLLFNLSTPILIYWYPMFIYSQTNWQKSPSTELSV